MKTLAYIYLMIIRLKKGESIEYKAKQCGKSVQEIEELNGFLPKENDWFYVSNVDNIYVVNVFDDPFSASKKTGLKVEEILKRVDGVFEAGKEFYY